MFSMKIFRTIKCAAKGIMYAVKNERNMRIHTVAAFYVLLFSNFFTMTPIKYVMVISVIGLVFMAEMFNTAIEGLIDLCSKEYNSTAKAAKDVSAGAVLVVCFMAVIVGVLLFSEPEAYLRMWTFLRSYPRLLVLFLVSLVLNYFYVFLGPVEMKNRIRDMIRKIKRNKISS